MTCGSSLVAKDQDNTWTSMSADNRRNVAASIVRSMDHVMARMITVFDEPAKVTIQADNMGM